MTENELMLTSILDCRRVDLVVDPQELTPPQKLQYEQMQVRRTQGEPLQYILGQCDFMGIPLCVDARVLIPRPETEILVELAIEKLKSIRTEDTLKALDLGTGSGNIAIALAKNISNAAIMTLDISKDALALALQNAQASGVEHKISFLCTDMVTYLENVADQGIKFDMIVSNPPYIPTAQLMRLPEDVRKEPRLALDGGEDGLRFYKTIIQHSHRALSADGFLLMEIGDGQRQGIEAILGQFPEYQPISFYKDYVGTDRIVCAQWKN